MPCVVNILCSGISGRHVGRSYRWSMSGGLTGEQEDGHFYCWCRPRWEGVELHIRGLTHTGSYIQGLTANWTGGRSLLLVPSALNGKERNCTDTSNIWCWPCLSMIMSCLCQSKQPSVNILNMLTNSDWYEDNHLFSVMLVAIKHERPCGRKSWVYTGFLKGINGWMEIFRCASVYIWTDSWYLKNLIYPVIDQGKKSTQGKQHPIMIFGITEKKTFFLLAINREVHLPSQCRECREELYSFWQKRSTPTSRDVWMDVWMRVSTLWFVY